MALTPDQSAVVARLRTSMSEDLTITDEDLYQLYTDLGSDDAVLAVVWERTAILYAGLTDVREGSSTRSFKDLYTRALELSALYRGRANDASGIGVNRRTRTRAIVRP